MPIVAEKLLNYPIPEVRQTLRWQDTALYNFSVGLGQDPMDERQLDFVYEPRLKAMPSMPVVLGMRKSRMTACGRWVWAMLSPSSAESAAQTS